MGEGGGEGIRDIIILVGKYINIQQETRQMSVFGQCASLLFLPLKIAGSLCNASLWICGHVANDSFTHPLCQHRKMRELISWLWRSIISPISLSCLFWALSQHHSYGMLHPASQAASMETAGIVYPDSILRWLPEKQNSVFLVIPSFACWCKETARVLFAARSPMDMFRSCSSVWDKQEKIDIRR